MSVHIRKALQPQTMFTYELAPFSQDSHQWHHISLSELWKAPEAAPVPQPAVASTLQAAESAWPAPPKATGPPGPSPASYVATAGEMVDGVFFFRYVLRKWKLTVNLQWICYFHVSLKVFKRAWMTLDLKMDDVRCNWQNCEHLWIRFLKDNMSLFQPDRPVFVNFAGLRFWVYGCHEWDGILSMFFENDRTPVKRLVLLLLGFFLASAPRRLHSRYLVWRDSSRCSPTRWIQPICTSRAFHPMQMSCLDRKIGSFPDMLFFAGDVFHCMTPTGKIFKPAFFSIFLIGGFAQRLLCKTSSLMRMNSTKIGSKALSHAVVLNSAVPWFHA